MASTIRPVEETMKLSDTKQQFSKVINRVAKGEANVIVEKSGLPVAVVVSLDEYRHLHGEEPGIQGETLYHLVEQGEISADDLSDDEQVDLAVFVVHQTRWTNAARRIADERASIRRQNGEAVSDRDVREEYVRAVREVRAEYLAAISARQ